MLNLAIAKKELKNGYHHFVVFDGDKVKKCNTLFKGKLNSRSQLLKLCNVTFKDLDDVELLPYGFDFSKAVKSKNA